MADLSSVVTFFKQFFEKLEIESNKFVLSVVFFGVLVTENCGSPGGGGGGSPGGGGGGSPGRGDCEILAIFCIDSDLKHSSTINGELGCWVFFVSFVLFVFETTLFDP